MFEDIKAIQKTMASTAEFLKPLMASGEFNNNNDAFVLLKATLKAIRDRVTPGESMHLAGQLPALLRGFYFEGYDFSKTQAPVSQAKDVFDFLSDVRFHLGGHDYLNLEKTVPLAMRIIFDSIDQGEARQVKQQLPKEIQNFSMQ